MSGPILITGGAGSVGRHLVEKFANTGQRIRIFDLPQMDFSGLEEDPRIEVIKGDATKLNDVTKAIRDVSSIIHLAAILPPNSERSRDITFRVNVGGTENIIRSLEETNPTATLVFTSSISTYGDTSHEVPPVTVSHPQQAIDIYADSKIEGERIMRESSLRNTISLRTAAIAVPAFLEPPDPWPFMEVQRVEMVHRDDVVDALFNAARLPRPGKKVFNIAGGSSWQLYGRDYVNDFYEFMGAPSEEANYRETPGWVDWYDTEMSQAILKYQNRSYQDYANEMRAIVEALMSE